MATIRRRSCEILFDLCKKVGFGFVADRIGLKEITIRKWTEPSKFDEEDLPFDRSGKINPLDRTAEFLRIMATDHPALGIETINWLARELGGAYITSEELDSMMAILAKVQREEKQKRKAG